MKDSTTMEGSDFHVQPSYEFIVDHHFPDDAAASFAASVAHLDEIDLEDLFPFQGWAENDVHHDSENSLATENEQFTAHIPVNGSSTLVKKTKNESESNNIVKKKRQMSEKELRECVDELLLKSTNCKLPRGEIKNIAAGHKVSRITMHRVWKQVKEAVKNNSPIYIKRHHKGKCGRKPSIVLDEGALMAIPLKQRRNVRSLSDALGIKKSTVHRFIKAGKIKRVSNCLKPHLSTKNKIERIRWCYKQLEQGTINTNPRWKDMYNVIHVDEKWFDITEKKQKVYLAPSESHPHRTITNKNFIPKVMFLVAVARPRFNEEGICTFDGKIGCFPFVEMVPAQRSSAYRPKGTLEMKPIKSITREVIKQKFISELLPAIKRKWPLDDNGEIYIQQDNAPPHLKVTDEDFLRVAHSDGFNINIISQPPQSPELNVLDLGFFSAIESIQHEKNNKSVTKLVEAVKYAYDVYDPKKLNRLFLTLQCCLEETLKHKGNNNYDLPHIKKECMERKGELPIALNVDKKVLESSLAALQDLIYEDDEEISAIRRNAQLVAKNSLNLGSIDILGEGGRVATEPMDQITTVAGQVTQQQIMQQ